MRLVVAPASTLADAWSDNGKTRPYPRGFDRKRVMVSLWAKATGASVISTLAGLNLNVSGLADTSKPTLLLSYRLPDRSTYRAGNERFIV